MPFQFLVLVLVSSIGAFSGTLSTAEQEFIERFKAYAAFQEITVKFRQEKKLAELKNPLKASGILHVNRRGRSLRWEIVDPSPMKVDIGGDRVVIETGTGSTREIQTYDMKQIGQGAEPWQNLSLWMDFNPEKIVEVYEVSKIGPMRYRLEPKKGGPTLFKQLTVSASKKGHIQRIEMVEPSDDTVSIDFEAPTIRKQ